MQVLPTGWLYKTPIEINIVEIGAIQQMAGARAITSRPVSRYKLTETRLGFSASTERARLIAPISPSRSFRAAPWPLGFIAQSGLRRIGKGPGAQRGPARWRCFPVPHVLRIEKPEAGASAIVIHALLDSPSVTGAYRFVVTPGAPTDIDVSVTLYPRRELVNVGLAPRRACSSAPTRARAQ